MHKIFLSLLLLTSSILYADLNGTGKYTVNSATLKVRLAPTTRSVHSYSIYKNQKVSVYEIQNNWARISKYTTTSVQGNVTRTAKWVYGKYITPLNSTTSTQKNTYKKPKKTLKKSVRKQPKKRNSRLTKAISGSDGFNKHSKVFIAVSEELIHKRVCKVSDFRKTRGWMELKADKMYFAYCGGFSKRNKLFLDINTSEVKAY